MNENKIKGVSTMETQAAQVIGNVTIFEDVNLVAFFKLKGFKVEPLRCVDEPSRIAFEVSGDEKELEATINKFYGNDSIPIQDYLKCLKELKSNMHAMKRIGKG